MSKRDKRRPRYEHLVRSWEKLIAMASREIRAGRGPVLVVTANPLDGSAVVGFHPAYGDVEDKVLFLTELLRVVRTCESSPLDSSDSQEAP